MDNPAVDRDIPVAAVADSLVVEDKDKVDTVALVGFGFGLWRLDIPPKAVVDTPAVEAAGSLEAAGNPAEVAVDHKQEAEASEFAWAFPLDEAVAAADNH